MHATEIIHILCVHYLCILALCIAHDDVMDVFLQSSNMASNYFQAQVCVIALLNWDYRVSLKYEWAIH